MPSSGSRQFSLSQSRILAQVLPEVVVEGGAVLVVEVGGVEHGPVEVELALAVGAVAEPYRRGVHVARRGARAPSPVMSLRPSMP